MSSSKAASLRGAGPAGIIDRLAQLQNLIKRDPEAYVDEFRLQHKNYQAELELLKLRPNADHESFRQLVTFLSHVAPCYKAEMSHFPDQLLTLLSDHAAAMDPEVRRSIAIALMLLRNRTSTSSHWATLGVRVEAIPLLKVFFNLFRVRDKYLRELVFSHIVNDIKNINTPASQSAGKRGKGKRNNNSSGGGASALALVGAGGGGGGGAAVGIRAGGGDVNHSIQTFMYSMLQDDSPVAAKKSLDVMIELYKRRVWTDARTVNVIATALLSTRSKLLVTALKFFLGLTDATAGDNDDDGDDDDSSDDGGAGGNKKNRNIQMDTKQLESIKNENLHKKKTRKRLRATAKHLATMRKATLRKGSSSQPLFPAIQLLHDPQGLAEKMLAAVRKGGDKFEVRLMSINFITRLVGQHRLIMLPLYSFLQRYLSAHTSHVTQLLAYLIQGCHDLVPPDELAPVVRAIANSFVSDGCGPEVLQVGLNSLREIFMRCPGVLAEEGMGDLVSDLVLYRKQKNKGVVASARSILNLVREWYPSLLRRRDRGKTVALDSSKAAARPTAYGAVRVATGVEGADLLALALALKARRRKSAVSLAAAAAAEGTTHGNDADGDEAFDSGDEEEEEESGDDEGAVDDGDDESSVNEEEIVNVQDSDEWVKVARAKARVLARQGKQLSRAAETALGLKKRSKKGKSSSAISGAGAGGDVADLDEDAAEDADELTRLLLGEEEDEEGDDEEESDCDDEEHHHHHGHSHKRARGDDEDEDEEEEDEEEDDEEDEDDKEDDKDEEDEEEEEEEIAPRSKKSRRDGGGGDDEKEDVPAGAAKNSTTTTSTRTATSSSQVGLTTSAASSAPIKRGAGSVVGMSSVTSGATSASKLEKLAAAGRTLEATRILTPKDYVRIKAIKAKLAERGLEGASAQDILRMLAAKGNRSVSGASALSGNSSSSSVHRSHATTTAHDDVFSDDDDDDDDDDQDSTDDDDNDQDGSARKKQSRTKKKRGGRGLGIVDDEGNVISSSHHGSGRAAEGDDDDDEGNDDGTDQLAMPGTYYAPAIVSMDPYALEATETIAKRKQADRLMEVLRSKQKGRTFEGTKPGGGTTNKEKERKKNYLMVRKSGGVNAKLRADLKQQHRSIKKRLTTETHRSRKSQMRRRRA